MAVGAAAVVVGTIVAMYYARLGLTLSHYDARGHLIVARRVLDSITPGWQQIGAVWLPLPHLLNLLARADRLDLSDRRVRRRDLHRRVCAGVGHHRVDRAPAD